MLRFLSNIPIFRRIFIAFALSAIVPAVVLVSLTSFFLTSLNTQNQAVTVSFDAQTQAAQQQESLQRMNALLQTRFNQIVASLQGDVTDPSLAEAGGLVGADIVAREADFDQSLQAYRSDFELATSPNMSTIHTILVSNNPAQASSLVSDQQQALDQVAGSGGLWSKYKALQDQEITLLDSIDPAVAGHPATLNPDVLNRHYQQAYLVLWKANFDFTDLKNTWQRVSDDAALIGKTVTTVGPSQTQPLLIATSIALVLTLLIVMFSGYIVNLTIIQPLRQLASLTGRIRKGNTEARAKAIGRDEVAIVASSMNNMLDHIVRLARDAQEQRDNLQGQVEKLVNEVSGVGEGDLRVLAEVTKDSLGVLADSFNYMVEELSNLIVRVKLVAHEVEDSTIMTFDRMTQLVADADAQLGQIAEAAFGIERLAQVSQQVAERARVLDAGARASRPVADTGRQAVSQTVKGMGRIYENVQETSSRIQGLGQRSREINNIIEVISTIAHQTNRLALDAAIQAAMAGENGKGFGAVAADIRRLAERSKEQVTLIGRIVRSVLEDIGAVSVSMHDTERETEAGAQLAQEAGTALGSIFSVVERQAREIETIHSMVTQQQEASGEVVHIMRTVSQTTEQTSASIREAAQDMERLARLAGQLRSSVEAFKLREDLVLSAPMSNVTITPEDDPENPLTISGVFREVKATLQPANAASGYNVHNGYDVQTPAEAGRSSEMGYVPSTPAPYQQGNGWPNLPQQIPQQGNGAPYPPNGVIQGIRRPRPTQPSPYDRPTDSQQRQ